MGSRIISEHIVAIRIELLLLLQMLKPNVGFEKLQTQTEDLN